MICSFIQCYDLDYKKIYVCIVKSIIYQTLLALAAFFNLEIEQVDFLSVYLHSNLDEKTYVEQSKKFEIDEIDNKKNADLYENFNKACTDSSNSQIFDIKESVKLLNIMNFRSSLQI